MGILCFYYFVVCVRRRASDWLDHRPHLSSASSGSFAQHKRKHTFSAQSHHGLQPTRLLRLPRLRFDNAADQRIDDLLRAQRQRTDGNARKQQDNVIRPGAGEDEEHTPTEEVPSPVEATQAPTEVQLAAAQSWAAGVSWARMGLTRGTMEQIPEYVRTLVGADSNGVHEGHTAIGHQTGYLTAGMDSAPDAQPWGRDSPVTGSRIAHDPRAHRGTSQAGCASA